MGDLAWGSNPMKITPRRRRDAEKTGIIFLFCALCASAVFFFGGCAKKEQAQADLILHHGKVVTVDHNFSITEAIAVKDGKILRVGAEAEVLKLKGPGT